MSEVDRLSNSGLYPMLPIADKHRKDDSPGKPPPDPQRAKPEAKAAESLDPVIPPPPKSIIDEYA